MEQYNEISCISWNILAQIHYSNTIFKDVEIIDWNIRLIQILKIINGYDIICLQEVMLDTYEIDYKDLFNEYDYVKHSISKERSSRMGNVILWKKCKFRLNKSILKSSAVHIVLIYNDLFLWVSNVHLKAGLRSGEDVRLTQIQSTLKEWDKLKYKGFICGDFNDDLKIDGKLRLLIETKFKLYELPFNRYINKDNKQFDHVVWNGIDVKYNLNLQNVSGIPTNDMPSDHGYILFNVIL